MFIQRIYRRYYTSTDKALQIISEDGGVVSYHLEFTEWVDQISKNIWKHSEKIRDAHMRGNSSHIIDLAFFLGGQRSEISSYIFGGNSIDGHQKCAVYAGVGKTEARALFSYCADWIALGRWGVEIQLFLMNTEVEKGKSIRQQLADMKLYEQMERNSGIVLGSKVK